MRLLLAGLLTALGLSTTSAATIDDLHRALETSDTNAVTSFVTRYYRDAGISVNEMLIWEHQAFDEIVNWYNQNTEVIMLSDLPANADEVSAYWQNWSKVLTQDKWVWRDFFADDAEAALIANFNQFLLAAHEYGHALTYRYDPGHEQRGNNEINCREYPADRLAAALLDELAEKDKRLADLRTRYRALIAEINANIAPEFRYDTPTFSALDENCALLHVAQPTDDPLSMTPYASAFFVRQGLLQAQDLPPLAEVYERHLLSRWRELQVPPSGTARAVTTGEYFDRPFGATRTSLPDGALHLAIDPSGNRYTVDAGYSSDGEEVRIAFGYGPAGGPIEPVLPSTVLAGVKLDLMGFFDFAGFLALGPDRFAAITGSPLGNGPIQIIDMQRQAGTWSMHVVDLVPDPSTWPDITGSALAWGSDGTPYAFTFNYLTGWTRFTLNKETLAPLDAVTFSFAGDLGTPFAVGPNGETYLGANYRVLVVGPDGATGTFAGAGIQGFKDNADPMLAEIAAYSITGRVTADGIELFDYDQAAERHVVRHIAWAR